MRMARRIENLPPYLFVEITKKIAEKRARGEEVISFAIGDPDIPTPPHIIDKVCQAAQDPANHRYPESEGLPELRWAIAAWYEKRFGVSLDPDKEVLPLIGAKEGIAHIALCFIDPGDIALVPDPAYPVYSIGTILTGGKPYYLPLTEKNNFLPDFNSIPEHILKRAKLLWINYPNNPTGAVAELDFFNRTVDFARKNDLAICHDGPYSEAAFDDFRPVSFIQDCIQEHNAVYQRRRDLVVDMLNNIGLEAKPPKASLYVWAKVPEGYTSLSFAADLLEQVGVVVTPGIGYGQSGEGYVRLSLTIPDAGLVKGLSRLAGWRDSKNRFKVKR